MSLEALCDQFGKSRQAYYQREKQAYKEAAKFEIIHQVVEEKRKLMPRLGGRKLLYFVQAELPEDISIGRDAFFDLLRKYNLLVRTRIHRPRTTNSNHNYRKYSNLIKDFIPQESNQLWVSDITYIKTSEGFVYLNLITDAYSRKIIGWALGPTLEAKYSIDALKMALKQLPKGTSEVYHHSDRGVQYCCRDYVKALKKNKFRISMTESGNPRDNAIAERINGILKDEWINHVKLKNYRMAKDLLKDIIRIYNQERPHTSLDMKTPEEAHTMTGTIKRRWKNYYPFLKENDSFVSPNEAMATHNPMAVKNGWGIEPHPFFAQQSSGSPSPKDQK